MKLFDDLRISAKLLLAFGSVLALTAALGIFSIFQLAHINAAAVEIEQNWLPSVRAILEMKAATGRHRSVILQHILSDDTAKMDQYEKRIADFSGDFAHNQTEFEARISSPEARQAYGVLTSLWQQYLAESQKLTTLARQQKSEEAIASSRGESSRLATAVHTQIGKLVELNVEGSSRAGRAAQDMYASARVWLFSGLALCMALGLALAVAIARSVSRPLQQAVAVAQAVAAGDLTSRIGHTSGDETGVLLQALKQMNASLQRMVGEVRGGAQTIATASGQIAAGNLDLSARTEEQASSLEETAASMEELTTTVRQNADHATQALGLARSASEVAVRGGAAVSQVAATMSQIQASARQIASITGEVDGIAFQTNILALNAAVEAARAGEQGRGFAVVAGEVRNLAQRSAAAAKEIKRLIDDAVDKIGAGSTLADQAGATMQEIVGSVKRVSDIMGSIGAATHEQAAGIGQVNQAITQMDQVTQQNAALVEEASAASASMQEQAMLLARAVSVFVLDEKPAARPGQVPSAGARPLLQLKSVPEQIR